MAQITRSRTLVILLIVLGGLLPIIMYWWILGRVPTITASEAIRLLNQADGKALLVDVRREDAFVRQHVEGAQHWSMDAMVAIRSPTELPDALHGNTLIFICDTGFAGATVTRLMRRLGLTEAFNVRGGMQEWAKAGAENPNANYSHFVSYDGQPYLSIQHISAFEQTAQVFAGFVIKPLYMMLSLLFAWILRRMKSPDMVALRWSLLFFFVGEAFCATNYIVFQDNSLLSEYLHSIGMAVAFGFAMYALAEGIDARVLRMSAPGKTCAIVGLCGPCSKYQDVGCKGRRMFQWLLIVFTVLALLPLSVKPSLGSYSSHIFGILYHYAELAVFQLLEVRYLPILALLLFAIALGWMRYQRDTTIPKASRVLFSAGLGALGFGLFRLVLVFIFADQLLWAGFWEEATELLTMLLAGVVLWTFRRQLLKESISEKRETAISPGYSM